MSLTYNEIYAQYDALEKTIARMDEAAIEMGDFMARGAFRSVLFTGCGSSYMLACSMRTIASQYMEIPVYALPAGDLWLNCARYEKMLDGALIVTLSRSGRTSEVLRAVEAARGLRPEVKVLSILCAEDTPLEEVSELTVSLPWAFDESVCQTRCVSNLYAAGALFIAQWAGIAGVKEGFEKVAQVGEEYLRRSEARFEGLAARPFSRVMVLADGEIDGLASEGALAFREIAQIPGDYAHLLDVRHGPMVLIREDTLVIAALSAKPKKAEMDLIKDVQKKNATLVVYANQPIEIESAECFSLGEEVGEIAGGLGLIALCQMVALKKARFVGCDPDKPDDLDPWIRIE